MKFPSLWLRTSPWVTTCTSSTADRCKMKLAYLSDCCYFVTRCQKEKWSSWMQQFFRPWILMFLKTCCTSVSWRCHSMAASSVASVTGWTRRPLISPSSWTSQWQILQMVLHFFFCKVTQRKLSPDFWRLQKWLKLFVFRNNLTFWQTGLLP